MKIDKIVDNLSNLEEYKHLYHYIESETPMPSVDILTEFVENMNKIIFPGFFSNYDINKSTLKYYIGTLIDESHKMLCEQIQRGLCFSCNDKYKTCSECETKAKNLSSAFFEKLPDIKHLLSTDVVAAYNGDPAATSYGEAIFCYPSIKALTHHRIAHELYKLDVPIIPRIISELSHSKTGIDIHPGANIGKYFFIDHGTGVVIGETTVIGENVRLYQGVTLGAKSFPMDKDGKPIKGIARHPIVEDDVTIYSNATILGRIRIGKAAVIGGNMWITKDVKSQEKMLLSQDYNKKTTI